MSQSSVPLRLDQLGGLSHTSNLDNFSGSESNILKIEEYLKKNILPLKSSPKVVFVVYVVGFLISAVLLVNIFLVTSVESNAVLALVVACPVLLILLGGVGGYFESKWKKAVGTMQRKVLVLTDKKCAIEVGFVPRCGRDLKQSPNICLFREAYLVVFDLENYTKPIKRRILYESPCGEHKCVISPFQRTSVQRHKLDKTAPIPNPLESGRKVAIPLNSGEGNSYKHLENPEISAKTIEMGPVKNEDELLLKEKASNPYQTDSLGQKEAPPQEMSNDYEPGPIGRRFSEGEVRGEDYWADDHENKFK